MDDNASAGSHGLWNGVIVWRGHHSDLGSNCGGGGQDCYGGDGVKSFSEIQPKSGERYTAEEIKKMSLKQIHENYQRNVADRLGIGVEKLNGTYLDDIIWAAARWDFYGRRVNGREIVE